MTPAHTLLWAMVAPGILTGGFALALGAMPQKRRLWSLLWALTIFLSLFGALFGLFSLAGSK